MGQRVCSNPDCGRSVADDAEVCKHCGTELTAVDENDTGQDDLYLPLVCPDCGVTIKARLRQCPQCGYLRPNGDTRSRETTASAGAGAAPPPKKSPPPKEAPRVIVPRKEQPAPKPAPEPAPKPAPEPAPKPAPEPAPEPPAAAAPKSASPPQTKQSPPQSTAPKAATAKAPTPPTPQEQKTIESRPPREAAVPPPSGLDDSYLPERPEDLPEKEIHVYLRGLQWAAKPMDYPTLIRNMREHKIGPGDFIYDRHQSWRTVAEIFNLPEVD